MTVNEYVGSSHRGPESTRGRETQLLSSLLGPVLRDGGLVEVATEFARMPGTTRRSLVTHQEVVST